MARLRPGLTRARNARGNGVLLVALAVFGAMFWVVLNVR